MELFNPKQGSFFFHELAVPQFSVGTNENGPINSENGNNYFGGLKGKVQ